LQVRWEAIKVLRYTGRIAAVTGDLSGALRDYGQARDLALGLSATFTGKPEHALVFAEVCNDSGMTLAGRGRITVLLEGLAHVARLRRGDPDSLSVLGIEFTGTPPTA
jgi:hypothetical protein